MMAQSRAESTRDTYNYGQYLNQFPPNTIKVIREFERIQKKICRHKMSIMFNEICINEKMLALLSFFQAAVVSMLLYGCTTWTLTKQLEKKLDGNYTRMLRAILNKSWRQHPTRRQLYGHLPPITKLYRSDEPDTRDTAGEARTSS